MKEEIQSTDTASGEITGITRPPSFIAWEVIAPLFALVNDYELHGRDDDASVIAGRIPRDGQPPAPVITFGNLRAVVEAALAPSTINSLAVTSHTASEPAPPVCTSDEMGRSGTTPAGGAGDILVARNAALEEAAAAVEMLYPNAETDDHQLKMINTTLNLVVKRASAKIRALKKVDRTDDAANAEVA